MFNTGLNKSADVDGKRGNKNSLLVNKYPLKMFCELCDENFNGYYVWKREKIFRVAIL